jgi:hypothetical protein
MMKSAGLLAAVFALGLCVQGCDRGPAEKAGEKVDSAMEQADGGSKDSTDGPAENAGEAVDQAGKDIGAAIDSAGDKADDAAKDSGN